jgi:acetoin utilization protein AcuB
MSESLTTVTPDASVEEAASLLVVKKIGCLPVVADGALVGIVTETDLLAVLVELLGLLTQSTRLDVGVAGGPDAYERIVEIIRAHDGRIISVGAVPGSAGKTVFSVRLEPRDPRPIVEALRAAGFEVLSHRWVGA